MKRLICAVLTVVLLTTVATGCGNSKKNRILYNETKLSKAVELGDYKGISVDTKSDEYKKVYDSIISDDVVNNDLYVKKTEGKVANGDVANIDYVGKKDGVAFEGGTDKGYDLEIGSNSFIDGFESGLIGVEIGSTVDLNLKFPENYGNEELNGAAVVFTVTVNYVTTDEERKPEDYFKEIDFKSLEDYEKDVTDRAIKSFLVDKITTSSKIKTYPEKDIDILYKSAKNTIEMNIKSQYGVDLSTYLGYVGQTEEQFKSSMITEQIKPSMESQMVIYAILDKENISFEQKEIDAEVNAMVKELANVQVDAKYLKEVYGEYYFEYKFVSDKVLDFIYKNAKIS